MRSKVKIVVLLLVFVMLMSGCSLLTLEQLYYPPKRSEEDNNLQSLIDQEMKNLTYSAPVSGENRQAVQNVDLDGDGVDEYLLFAKDDSDNPMKILIFSQIASGYVLMDTIEGYGVAYDFVHYVQLDDQPGVEIVVGRQISEDLTDAVAVYHFASGLARQWLSTGYSAMAVSDLDNNGQSELILFTSGGSDRSKGVVAMYSYLGGQMQRTHVSYMSQPVGNLQQVETGKLENGTQAVFVTSAENENTLSLDVFAVLDGALVNLTEGIRIPTIHNYSVYPTDIDEDGIMDIPSPVTLQSGTEFVLEWYTLGQNGKNRSAYTYHCFSDGWYLFLQDEWIETMMIQPTGDGVVFYKYDAISGEQTKIMTIYTFTGSDREEQAAMEGRVILYKGDSIIYALSMEEDALEIPVMEEMIMNIFHPIRKGWNSEESGE